MSKKLKRIVLIGPVYPYKGGIAHYTGAMCKELSKKYDVKLVSYKLQYPKLLIKKEQKDYGNAVFKVDEALFWINTANPFNWLKTSIDIRKLKPDLIIIQWWHPYFTPCYMSLLKLLRKYKKIYVCHNVLPHEKFMLDKSLAKIALKQGDAFIVQSHLDALNLETIIKKPVFIQTVHPTYDSFNLKNMDKCEGRRVLGLEKDTKVLLFFGFVRKYKGLKYLIEALRLVVDKYDNTKLLIVGAFENNREYYDGLIENKRLSKHIDIYDEYIPDTEVEQYFVASDLVVLPYESATQSGIVQIAYGFNKPVIATDVGGLPEVVIDNKTGYIVEKKNPVKLAATIIKFFDENREEEFCTAVKKEAYKYSWERMSENIEKLYNKI